MSFSLLPMVGFAFRMAIPVISALNVCNAACSAIVLPLIHELLFLTIFWEPFVLIYIHNVLHVTFVGFGVVRDMLVFLKNRTS
jgi:hypothetical protein